MKDNRIASANHLVHRNIVELPGSAIFVCRFPASVPPRGPLTGNRRCTCCQRKYINRRWRTLHRPGWRKTRQAAATRRPGNNGRARRFFSRRWWASCKTQAGEEGLEAGVIFREKRLMSLHRTLLTLQMVTCTRSGRQLAGIPAVSNVLDHSAVSFRQHDCHYPDGVSNGKSDNTGAVPAARPTGPKDAVQTREGTRSRRDFPGNNSKVRATVKRNLRTLTSFGG